MRKQLGIIILMLCAVVLQAQQMTSPSYLKACKQGAISPRIKVFQEMYKDIQSADKYKFSVKWLGHEYWNRSDRSTRGIRRRPEFSYNKHTGEWEAHHFARLIDVAIEADNDAALRTLTFEMRPRYLWPEDTIYYPDGRQEKISMAGFFKKAVELKKLKCIRFFLQLNNGVGRQFRETVPESLIKKGKALSAQLEQKKAQDEKQMRAVQAMVKADLRKDSQSKRKTK